MNNLNEAVRQLALSEWFRDLEALQERLDSLATELQSNEEGTDAAIGFLDKTAEILEGIERRMWSVDRPENTFPLVAALFSALRAAHAHVRLIRESVFTAVHKSFDLNQARQMYIAEAENAQVVADRLSEAIDRLREEVDTSRGNADEK